MLSARSIVLGLLSLNIAGQALAAELKPEQQEKLLQRFDFWDNKDWNWYRENIPIIETPDQDLDEVYYYRWQLLTKHLRYGNQDTAYVFTEFNDAPSYAGAFGAIVAPAGHQLWESQWLRNPIYSQNTISTYLNYSKAKPFQYATWLLESTRSLLAIHPDESYLQQVLPELEKHYLQYENSQFDAEQGLYWSVPVWEATEHTVSSKRTADSYHGGDGYRPVLNSYMAANAAALAKLFNDQGQGEKATSYQRKADALIHQMKVSLWDDKRQFFLHRYRHDERNGIVAGSLIDETGPHKEQPRGRELMGYAPWAFDLIGDTEKFSAAWKFIGDSDYFYSKFGPRTAELQDPDFAITPGCCHWAGNSWPYATSIALKAYGNFLQSAQGLDTSVQGPSLTDYHKVLNSYIRLHQVGQFNGEGQKPYIAEGANPNTGSWDGHDRAEHSEHYFHSSYVDLILSGVLGLKPAEQGSLEIKPLVPTHWNYFILDNLRYQGHELSVIWDLDGKKYQRGKGFTVIVDGERVYHQLQIPKALKLTLGKLQTVEAVPRVNFVANNTTLNSSSGSGAELEKIANGKYYYTQVPGDFWQSSGEALPWLTLEFPTPVKIDQLKFYPLVNLPVPSKLEYLDGSNWRPLKLEQPSMPLIAQRANEINFAALSVAKIRLSFELNSGQRLKFTEIEAWGDKPTTVKPEEESANLAVNLKSWSYPRANASFSFVGHPAYKLNDGDMSTSWSTVESRDSMRQQGAEHWVEIDFAKARSFSQIKLYAFEKKVRHSNKQWQERVTMPKNIKLQVKTPHGQWQNFLIKTRRDISTLDGGLELNFDRQVGSAVRLLLSNQPKSQLGFREVEVFNP